MGSRGADSHSPPARDVAYETAEESELLGYIGRRAADGRRHLEDGLHQLRVDPWFELVSRHRGKHRVDMLNEVEGLRVEQHVFLLRTERVRIALAKGVVEDAAALRETAALPRDRRRVDLLH